MNFEYDVVIVGAGPAGCLAALKAPGHLRILLIDRLDLPRNLICGGIVRPGVVERLLSCELPAAIFREPCLLEWELYDLRLGRRGGLKGDTYLNVDRQEFDEWLLALVRERNGVDVWPQTRFLSAQSGSRGLTVSLNRAGEWTTVAARFLIGADGAASSVRRFLGAARPRRWNMVQATIHSQGAPVDKFLGFIGDDIDFYGWVIPKGGELLIGVGCDAGCGNGRTQWQAFSSLIEQRFDIFGPLVHPLKARPTVRLQRPGEIVPGRGRILLAGEAAGYVSPWSGEGISYALISGALAGQSLGFPHPLHRYRRRPLGELRPRLLMDLAGRKVMKRANTRLLAASLAPWVTFKRF